YGNSRVQIERPRRSHLRAQLTVSPIKSIRLRSRLEFSFFSANESGPRHPPQLGAFISQDLRWRPNDIWSLQTCCSFFDAPSYETRFYQFENDLPGVMRLKMLSGRGKRSYFLLSCKFSQQLKVHFKYENTWFDDAESIGSGNDIVLRPRENSLSCQLEWRF
ncbi:hypothetical protein JXA02_04670, partial [candidate division KSB1 bacterium]|nr:hypothetical protein [candidate division KSB1 bacterium]